MMQKFSEPSSYNSKTQPSEIIQNSLFDFIRRRLNKLLGRASTQEVGIMATLISTIKERAEAESQTSVKNAVIAMPNLFGSDNLRRARFQEDLEEASKIAGLNPLLTPFWLGSPAAAAASQGWGMCEHYDNIYTCEDEQDRMPLEMVLAIEYTTHALIVTMFPLKSATSNSDELTRVSFVAGSNNEGSKGHWERVRGLIRELPTTKDRAPLTKVIVMGESADSDDFLNVVREALAPQAVANLTYKIMPQEFSPLYAVARGAAEFAKRKQEAPKGCIETEECKKIRKQLIKDYTSTGKYMYQESLQEPIHL